MIYDPCVRHPDKPAERLCEICDDQFCAFCTTRPSGTMTIQLCPACGADGRLVRSKPRGTTGDLADELRTAFSYPFADGGWMALVAGALMGGIGLFVLRFGIFMLVLVIPLFLAMVGYLWTWLLQIVSSTAYGEDSLPDWPDFTSVRDSALRALVLFLLVLLCLTPAIGAWYLGLRTRPALLGAFLLGCCYFPMGMLTLSMAESLAALNPLIVIPSIFKVGRGYLLAIAALVGVMVVRLLVQTALGHIPLLGAFVLGGASLYFLVVQARIVGLLYRVYERDLGWF